MRNVCMCETEREVQGEKKEGEKREINGIERHVPEPAGSKYRFIDTNIRIAHKCNETTRMESCCRELQLHTRSHLQ